MSLIDRELAADIITWGVLLTAAAAIWAIEKTLGRPSLAPQPEPPRVTDPEPWPTVELDMMRPTYGRRSA